DVAGSRGACRARPEYGVGRIMGPRVTRGVCLEGGTGERGTIVDSASAPVTDLRAPQRRRRWWLVRARECARRRVIVGNVEVVRASVLAVSRGQVVVVRHRISTYLVALLRARCVGNRFGVTTDERVRLFVVPEPTKESAFLTLHIEREVGGDCRTAAGVHDS